MACSPQERKLMAELEAMKELVAKLKSQAVTTAVPDAPSRDDNESDRIIADLQAQLANKQNEYMGVTGSDGSDLEQKKLEEIDMYAKRGISLTAYETSNTLPYFVNLDDDAFRSNRFMYILRKEITMFGNKQCDVQLMSLSVLRDHCSVRFDSNTKNIFIRPVKGDLWINGKPFPASKTKGDNNPSQEIKLNIYDRIALGDQLMMFRYPILEDEYTNTNNIRPISGSEAVEEYQEGLVNSRNNNTGGGLNNGDMTDEEIQKMENERKRIREERDNWEKEKSQFQQQRNDEDYQRAMSTVDNAILDLLPKLKEAKSIVDLMNRVTMSFDIVLEKSNILYKLLIKQLYKIKMRNRKL